MLKNILMTATFIFIGITSIQANEESEKNPAPSVLISKDKERGCDCKGGNCHLLACKDCK